MSSKVDFPDKNPEKKNPEKKNPEKKNLLGIDFGKRIGVAIAIDKIALPICVAYSIQQLYDIIIFRKINFLVVGWPISLNGAEGMQCESVKSQLNNLLKLINLPYFLQDERFSSKFTKDDAHAASFILQSFINSNLRDL